MEKGAVAPAAKLRPYSKRCCYLCVIDQRDLNSMAETLVDLPHHILVSILLRISVGGRPLSLLPAACVCKPLSCASRVSTGESKNEQPPQHS